MSDENMHPAVKLIASDGEPVEVDEALAPLIKEIWAAGIGTLSCCQDAAAASASLLRSHPHLVERSRYNAGYAYIDFLDDEEAIAFLNAVANAGPRNRFYERMTHWAAPKAWRKILMFFDDALGDTDPANFWCGAVKIFFPISDIDEIVRRLRRHNEQAGQAS